MSNISKVDNLVEAIKSRILNGEFGNEGRLPSFRTLATEYGTTQETMNKTMQSLQAEGLLISKGAKGVFVNNPRIILPGIIAHFFKYIEKEGFESKGETLTGPDVIKPPAEVAKAMGLTKKDFVLYRRRRQGTIDSPLRLVDGYYPMAFITEDMLKKAKSDPYYHIADAIQKHFKQSAVFIHEEVLARLPNQQEQEELKIVRNNPVIDAKFTHYAEDKKTVVVYNHMILNANHFMLTYDYSLKEPHA
jgi:DNA-binding GntR family transcriptional regulator